jgi:hypothetical protein
MPWMVAFAHSGQSRHCNNLSAIGVTADMPNEFSEPKTENLRRLFRSARTAHGVTNKNVQRNGTFSAVTLSGTVGQRPLPLLARRHDTWFIAMHIHMNCWIWNTYKIKEIDHVWFMLWRFSQARTR